MPGRSEFTYPVGGSGGGTPVSMSQAGAFETDNYGEAGTIQITAYPTTIDPDEFIENLIITETGTEIVATITTKTGTKFDAHLRGAGIDMDTLEVDQITFKDPTGSGAATYGWWVGE